MNYPEAIEDAFQIDDREKRLAISDGASESFDSKTWAQILVSMFIQYPEFSTKWLSEVIQQYNAQFDISSLSWSKCAAFERGSFATLIGIESLPEHSSLELLSIGDSLAVLLNGTNFIDSFPYNSSHHFQQRPELLSTNRLHNEFINNANFFTRHSRTWDLKLLDQPVLL